MCSIKRYALEHNVNWLIRFLLWQDYAISIHPYLLLGHMEEIEDIPDLYPMKHFLFCMLLIATGYQLTAQPRIHAHNDYQQALPLTNALRNNVFSIEADVYLRNGQLVVAHTAKDVAAAPSLD